MWSAECKVLKCVVCKSVDCTVCGVKFNVRSVECKG